MKNGKIRMKIVSEDKKVVVKYDLINISPQKVKKVTGNSDKKTFKEGFYYSSTIDNFINIVDNSGMNPSDLIIDKKSIKIVYCFEDDKVYFSEKLTKSFLKKWFSSNSFKLYKYDFNNEKFNFSEILIESSCITENISKNITSEEINLILSCCSPKLSLYEKLKKVA